MSKLLPCSFLLCVQNATIKLIFHGRYLLSRHIDLASMNDVSPILGAYETEITPI